MELIFVLTVFLAIFSIAGGCMAKSFGRKFWIWFLISVLLPFVSLIILISLPDKKTSRYLILIYETDEFGMYN